MRALCLLALIGATLPGCCCSAHRAWKAAYDPCVSQGDDCHITCHQCGRVKKKSTRCRCAHCSACGEAGGFDVGNCATGCGSPCGNECGGCSSCDPGQMACDGSLPPAYSSMPHTSTCPTCDQTQMSPLQTEPAHSPPMTPPAPPAATPYNPPPMPSAPEPEQARLLQPMSQQHAPLASLSMAPQLMQPLPVQSFNLPPAQTQPIQHQEWQPHQPAPQSFVPYTPPATEVPQQSLVPQQSQTALQPVLWVPSQSQAPLLMPAQ
jgi:hypothetical protein